ncbi:hypothetical protein SK128_010986 [Halocaridina rubra]|uniref:Uncharacterized protein n=1 Tax=Halocaridina rubra TaxID=373956 RepID=A0AAN8XI06_HALRR
MSRTPTEIPEVRGRKRSFESPAKNHDVSPPKIATPRTRSKAAKENSKPAPVPAPRSVKSNSQPTLSKTLVCTPKSNKTDVIPEIMKAPAVMTKTRKCIVKTPENSCKENTKTDFQCKSPIMSAEQTSRNRTPISSTNLQVDETQATRCNTPVFKKLKVDNKLTPSTNRASQESSTQETPRAPRSSPRLNHIARASPVGDTFKSQDKCTPGEQSKNANSSTRLSQAPKSSYMENKSLDSKTSLENVSQEIPRKLRSSPRLSQKPESTQMADIHRKQDIKNASTNKPENVSPGIDSDCLEKVTESDEKNIASPAVSNLENNQQETPRKLRSSPRLSQKPESTQMADIHRKQDIKNATTNKPEKVPPGIDNDCLEKVTESDEKNIASPAVSNLENNQQETPRKLRSSPRMTQKQESTRLEYIHKSQDTECTTSDKPEKVPRKTKNKPQVLNSSHSNVIDADCSEKVTSSDEKDLASTVINNLDPRIADIDIDSLRICLPVTTNKSVDTSENKEVISPIDSNAAESMEDLQKEVEKVKKRRSTIGGLSRRSVQSLGGRRSLCSTLPPMSLEDQISLIDKNLPHTSKISHLIDMNIRETMKRFEERFEGEESVYDLRLEILTRSEKIGSHIAYEISALPLEVDPPPKKMLTDTTKRFEKLEEYKKITTKLEQEYKAWKALMRERRQACIMAEREFNEAKSGETTLDEDHVKHLTYSQHSILSSRPDYGHYFKEVQMARETAFFATQTLNHVSSVIPNFMKATQCLAASCYAAIEEKTLGPPQKSSFQAHVRTLLSLEDG